MDERKTTKSDNKPSGGTISLFILIGTIILIIIAYVVWFLLLRLPGGKDGQYCNVANPCAGGYYCGGGNQCVSGSQGLAVGDTCISNKECTLGLYCLSGKCSEPLTSSTSITDNSFSLSLNTTTFSDKYIQVDVGGHMMYLQVEYKCESPTTSSWSLLPTQKFSYFNNTLTVTYKSPDEMKIVTNNIVVNNRGFLQQDNISSTKIYLKVDGTNTYFTDQDGNTLGIGNSGLYPLAIMTGRSVNDSGITILPITLV